MVLTAICSASGRATPTDARALLTREIQKIQRIRKSSIGAVVDSQTTTSELSETSIAPVSIFTVRRAYFGGLDAPAHPWLLERRAVIS